MGLTQLLVNDLVLMLQTMIKQLEALMDGTLDESNKEDGLDITGELFQTVKRTAHEVPLTIPPLPPHTSLFHPTSESFVLNCLCPRLS